MNRVERAEAIARSLGVRRESGDLVVELPPDARITWEAKGIRVRIPG